MRTITAVATAIALVVGLAIGGWQLGWWMQAESVNRTAQISQDSYGRQNALTEAVLRGINQLEDPNLPSVQRTALVNEVCFNAARLTGAIQLPQSATTFIAQEC